MRQRTTHCSRLGLAAIPAFLAFLTFLGTAPAIAASAEPPVPSAVAMSVARAEVNRLLSAQAVAWNRNDLDAFVAPYAQDATFLTSATGITHGRQAVLERYRKRYPDGKAMGSLTLNMVEVRPLGVDVASGTIHGLAVVARWQLAHPEDPGAKPAEGFTLLVLQRRAGHWEILEDASL